jgi:hypothetical protein
MVAQKISTKLSPVNADVEWLILIRMLMAQWIARMHASTIHSKSLQESADVELQTLILIMTEKWIVKILVPLAVIQITIL